MEIARPCITFTTGIAKAKFETGFDLTEARHLLLNLPYFSEIKISDRIGLLKTYGKITLMLFKDGTVSVKPVKDSEEGFRILKEIGAVLLSAACCPIIEGRTVSTCNGKPCPNGCILSQNCRIQLEEETDNKQN